MLVLLMHQSKEDRQSAVLRLVISEACIYSSSSQLSLHLSPTSSTRMIKDESAMEVFARVQEALEAPASSYAQDVESLFGPPILPRQEKQSKTFSCPHCKKCFEPDEK